MKCKFGGENTPFKKKGTSLIRQVGKLSIFWC
jgi:hypothetical protein